MVSAPLLLCMLNIYYSSMRKRKRYKIWLIQNKDRRMIAVQLFCIQNKHPCGLHLKSDAVLKSMILFVFISKTATFRVFVLLHLFCNESLWNGCKIEERNRGSLILFTYPPCPCKSVVMERAIDWVKQKTNLPRRVLPDWSLDPPFKWFLMQHVVLWQLKTLDFTVAIVGRLAHPTALGGTDVSGSDSQFSRDPVISRRHYTNYHVLVTLPCWTSPIKHSMKT